MLTCTNSPRAATRVNVRRSLHHPASRRSRGLLVPSSNAIESLERRCLLSAGFLDHQFGSGGVVVTTAPDGYNFYASSVNRLPDGKLLLAGNTSQEGTSVLVRYDADGQLDTDFGTAGIAELPLDGTMLETVVQSDGRVVVLTGDMYMTRYMPTGELDTSFGTAGKAQVWSPGPVESSCSATDVILLPDDSMWVAGQYDSWSESEDYHAFAISRVASDGATVEQQTVRVTGYVEGEGVLYRQPDGRVLLAGDIWPQDGNEMNDLVVYRFLQDGTADPSFGGGDGTMSLGVGTMNHVDGIGLQSDGSIVLGGDAYVLLDNQADLCFSRVTADGELDTSFGTQGFTCVDGGAHLEDWIAGIAIDENDRIIGAGTANAGYSNFESDFAVVRLTANGQMDAQCGYGGLVTTDVNFSVNYAADMTVVSDNRLVVVGNSTQDDEHYGLSMAQYVMDDLGMGAPTLAQEDDFGWSDSDGVTNVTAPRFDLTRVEPGSTITLYRDGEVVAVATDVPEGFSRIGDPGPVADGTYQYSVRQDAPGGAMGPISAPGTIVIHTGRPVDVEHGFTLGAPMELKIRWDEDTIFNQVDLNLLNATTGQTLPYDTFLTGYDANTHSMWITFSGFPNGVLPNGNYVATIPAWAVMDEAGNTMTADSVITFRVLTGDADDSGVVDFDDYVRIDNGFNEHLSGWANGDFNGDGRVDFDDYVLIDIAFNAQSTLPGIAGKAGAGSWANGDFNGDGRITFGDDVLRDIEISTLR